MRQLVLRLAPETCILNRLARQGPIDKNGLAILTQNPPRFMIQRAAEIARAGLLRIAAYVGVSLARALVRRGVVSEQDILDADPKK